MLDVARRRRRRAPPGRRRARAGRARREHVLRVPVGRRDDGAAGGDRERERAGGDLLAVAVRRHEDVGRREQIRSSSIERNRSSNSTWSPSRARARAARASGGTARPRDGRRPDASARRSRRRSPDAARSIAGSASITVSSPCPARSGRTSRAGSRSDAVRGIGADVARRARAAARAVRRAGAPCGTTRTFSSGQAPHSTSSRSAVSVITITSSASLAELREHFELMRRRLREHRVEGDDERLRQLLARTTARTRRRGRRRSRTRAGGARRRRRAGRASARCGCSRRGRPARSSRAAPRRCGRDGSFTTATTSTPSIAGDAEQRRTQVSRERADPAGTRRKGGDDRCTHRRYRRDADRAGTGTGCMRWGSCRPPRTEDRQTGTSRSWRRAAVRGLASVFSS